MADDPLTGTRRKPFLDSRAEPSDEEVAEQAPAEVKAPPKSQKKGPPALAPIVRARAVAPAPAPTSPSDRVSELEALLDAATKRAAIAEARAMAAETLLESVREDLVEARLGAALQHANAGDKATEDASLSQELEKARQALAAAIQEKNALAQKLAAEREAMMIEREGIAAERHELRLEREAKERNEKARDSAADPQKPKAIGAPLLKSAAAPEREKSERPKALAVAALAPALALTSVAHAASAAGSLASSVGVGTFVDAGGVGIREAMTETLKMAMRVVPWKFVARGASLMMLPAVLYANKADIKKTSDRMKNIPKIVISSRVASDIATEIEAASINKPLPKRKDFVAWVRTNYKGVPGTDPARDQWGTLMRLDEPPHMLGVRSAGPDRRFDTKDDIFRSVRDMGFNRM